jgi:tetratricopeptide (TPR) repeat protein
MILAPLLSLTLLEMGLRLGGYGYPTTFYIGPDADGAYMANNRFGWRFFSPALARNPVPSLISAKPADTIRIFVLGSSAAQGVPDPSFSFGQILQTMLRERYPQVKFEVVNAAMTAINSHVTLEIARDCAAYQPDLFIVYMGNNEVVGPFGPGTVFQQWSPNLKLIRANIWLKSTRTGQLLGNAMSHLRTPEGPNIWQGMEMFLGNPVAADDPRLAAVYGNFRQNLVDLCRTARRSGAGLILSTVAVNLHDCPPFASQHRNDLSKKELLNWESLYHAGEEQEAKEQWAAALENYRSAAKIDDRFAELPFRMGRCLAALGQSKEAYDQILAARDLDVLRFRADSKINETIREVAGEQATYIHLTDAERSFAQSDLSVGGIPGEKLFYEHVHMTFDGNYLMARTVLNQVESALPALANAHEPGPILTRQQCAESLAYTLWDEYRSAEKITSITSRAPFTNQCDHAKRHAAIQQRAKDLKRLANKPQSLKASYLAYEAALGKNADDWEFHHRFGNLAVLAGRSQEAIDHLSIALKKVPWMTAIYVDYANAMQQFGRLDEAIASYKKALEIDPNDVMIYNNLGNALCSRGRIEEAISQFQKSLTIDPTFFMAHCNLGHALNTSGRTEEAIAEYNKALVIEPNSAIIHNNLGNALKSRKQNAEAIEEYRKASKIDPEFIVAYNNLGTTLSNAGWITEAIDNYQKAVEIDPQCALTHYNLGNALAKCGRIDSAIAHFQQVLAIDPGYAMAHNNLGVLMAARGQLDEAITHFQKAVEIQSDYLEAQRNLKKTLQERDKKTRSSN